MMPEPTFLSQYAHMMESNETPEIYDLWAAMATLASTVSRKVWFDLGNIRILPNLYIVFVGPAGARKNTAMNSSQELLEALGDVPMIQGATTKEKLVEFMCKECKRLYPDPERDNMETEYSPLTIFSNELTHFLGTDGVKALHMVDFMTIIYDKIGDYDAGTISRGPELVAKPCVNLFSATTPNNIARYLKEEALSGGMARRTVFVYASRVKKPIPIPHVTEASKVCKAWCLSFLERASKVVGPFRLHPDAALWYNNWYVRVFNQVANERNDLIAGYLSSKHIQMFKLAMLSAINRNLDVLEIHVEDCMTADALLSKIESELPIVYEGLGINEQASVARRIVDAVRASGGKMADKEIRMVFFKDSKDLPKIMEHLQETGLLVCMASRNSDGTVRSRVWFLTDHPDVLRAKGVAVLVDAPTPESAASDSPPLPTAVEHAPKQEPQAVPARSSSEVDDRTWLGG